MKILFISLGCDKNLVDTEMMLGLLNKDGYTFTDDEHEADVVVVNTCCFIGDAKEESVNTILEMAEYFHIDSYSFLLLFLLDEKAISQHWETAFPIIITPQKQHPHPLEES